METFLANPTRFQERLLLPHSSFEFFKWNRLDTIGFAMSVLAVQAFIGMLYALLNIGT